MAFLYNQKLRKFTLTILLLWSSAFFWLLNSNLAINIAVSVVSFVCLLFILYERNAHFIAIYLSFITSFVLYGYMLVNNFPVWLIMIGVMLIFLYLFAYLEQKVEIIKNERIIYLFIFSLLSLETFLFLGYYLISPTNRSLILSLLVYLIYGFCDAILSKKKTVEIYPYILVFLLVFATMLLTASWGQI